MNRPPKDMLLKMIESAEIRLEAYLSNHDKEGVDMERRMIRMLKADLMELEE